MATKQCIECGKRIMGKSTVCPHCGASQDGKNFNEIVEEISADSEINNNMTACKTCGKQVSKNAKTCPHCGEILLESKPKEKKTSLITWLVMLLFIGYIVGEFGDGSKENSYTSKSSSKYTTKSTNRRGGGCSVGDFTIRQSVGWQEGRYYKVPFRVTNNCSKSAGVKIQMSYYGKDGTLLNVMSGWPASVSNISPGETYNDVWLKTVDQDVDRVTFKAVDVKVWR